MCGHGTIGVCTVLVEMGLVEVTEPITEIVLDTPSGTIRCQVQVRGGAAESVTLRNVPSFLYTQDVVVNVPSLGKVTVDIAYGGNFYAILPAASVGLQLLPEHAVISCLPGRASGGQSTNRSKSAILRSPRSTALTMWSFRACHPSPGDDEERSGGPDPGNGPLALRNGNERQDGYSVGEG